MILHVRNFNRIYKDHDKKISSTLGWTLLTMRTPVETNEFELKLSGSKAQIERAFDALATGAGGEASKRLNAVYFDTADLRLWRRQAALRVRKEDGRFVQALKLAQGPLERFEHEAETSGMAPEPDLLPPRIRPVLGALYPEDLAPVFATDVRRRKRDVTRDDGLGRVSAVEVAFDEGEVSAGKLVEPILELEVEAKRGDHAFVFEVGQDLVEAGASRIVTRSKAARGYALATGKAPAAARARKLELQGGESIGDALGRILEAVFAQWWANHDAAFDGRDDEGVHQLRVALRRLRSALTLFQPLLVEERRLWLAGEARWIMGVLGPARDLDVFTLEMLPTIASSRPNDAALASLRSAGEEARTRAYGRVRDALGGKRYARFLLGLGQWVTSRGWYGDADAAGHVELGHLVRTYAGGVLDQRARAVKKRGRDFESLDVEQRHEVRKSLKKLRYAAEFFRGVYPGKATKRYLDRLGTLQDAFGHMNDMAMAEGVLHQLVEPSDARLAEAKGLVLGYYAHAGAGMEPELCADWKAFAEASPFWSRPTKC